MATQYTQCHQTVLLRHVAAQALWLDPTCGDKSFANFAKPRLPCANGFFHISMSKAVEFQPHDLQPTD